MVYTSLDHVCLESLPWPEGVRKPVFHTTDVNGKVSGERYNRKTGTAFEFWLQLFADDAAMGSKPDLKWRRVSSASLHTCGDLG